ncbi:MAG: protein translocase subunit SecD [Bacillota bacterium]
MKLGGKSRLAILLCVTLGLAATSALGIGQNQMFGLSNIKQGLDLQGGVDILYEGDQESISIEEMEAAIALLQGRLDWKGYTEAEVAKEGDKRIRVQIPGVENPEEAIQEIGQTGELSFLDEDGNVVVSGKEVKTATKQVGDTNNSGMSEPYVLLEFTDTGKRDFATATAANIGKPIQIVMDDEVVSAPIVNDAITDGSAIVTGNFTVEEADSLAAIIRAGSLPFRLEVIQMQNVGAKLGADALTTGITAGIVGISLVIVYMIFTYKMMGLVASWALLLYLTLDMLALSAFGVTLTLPGLAGIILSVGMAVDANVIIFERIKEELNSGKSVRTSVKIGFKRALPAIVDGNFTTFLAGIILYYLGSGTIKGFASTLMIGIALSMFTAFVITKQIIVAMVDSGVTTRKYYGLKEGASK